MFGFLILYTGSDNDVPLRVGGRAQGAGKAEGYMGFAARRHTAISSCINRKAVKGIVGRSEASPLQPRGSQTLDQHLYRNGLMTIPMASIWLTPRL